MGEDDWSPAYLGLSPKSSTDEQTIRTPTVFVIGAGCGVPYGLPTGEDLNRIIIKAPTDHGYRERWSLVDEIAQERDSEVTLVNLAEALGAVAPTSIDALLYNRPRFLEVGKAAIAAALLPLEEKGAAPADKQDWLGFLLSKMFDPQAESRYNGLSIITFNYDRTI